MRFARRARTGPDERTLLLQLARDGDDAALAALRADLDPASLGALAALLGTGALALEVLRAARACTDRPAVLEGVVLLLLDGAGRSPDLVAELLDLPVGRVLAAREQALAGSGQTAAPPGCRGWLLVSRTDVLTGEEQRAAAAHLAECRRCAAARAASAQAVRRAGAAATAGAAGTP